MFDFGGMKSDLRSFRSVEPHSGHPVAALAWSPSGDAWLACAREPRVKLYDREGKGVGETVRGDMYIRDPRNTKGHTAAATAAAWHPHDRWTALTAGEDGTLRVWDTHNVIQKAGTARAGPGRARARAAWAASGGRRPSW